MYIMLTEVVFVVCSKMHQSMLCSRFNCCCNTYM